MLVARAPACVVTRALADSRLSPCLCPATPYWGAVLCSQEEERNRDPVLYVQGLLTLRDKYQQVIELAFESDKQFTNALNQAFENFMNLNAHSPECAASPEFALLLTEWAGAMVRGAATVLGGALLALGGRRRWR